MRIMLTGAGGFLGRHLIGMLTAAGHHVIAVSSQPEAELRNAWVASSEQLRGELIEVVSTTDLFAVADDRFASLDVLVNAGFPRAATGPLLAQGLDFQARLFGEAAQAGVGRAVNISSQSVYDGERAVAAAEGDEAYLDTPYATAKYASEIIAEALLGDIPLVHLRLSSLIGPGFDQRLVNKMVLRALAGHDLQVAGGAQIFDFMDVRDAARAVALMCEAPLQGSPETVNIGSANPMTLLEIAECVVRVLHEDFAVDTVVNVEPAESAPRSSALDCRKLIEEYGFAVEYDLRSTIRAIARTVFRGRGNTTR